VSQLRLTEIFLSLQGESTFVGLPTVFVRLTGCPLRCTYCDSAYAFQGGQLWTLEAIADEVARLGATHVTVTGGEPLAQPNCLLLLTQLCDLGYVVSLETSGALSIADVDARVFRIVDIKTPSSAEVSKNLWSNLAHLKRSDEIKFVIGSREDFDWALRITAEHQLFQLTPTILMSPVFQQVEPANLAAWVLAAAQPFRMQVQLHKILWGDTPGR
jgi:7-carboxy-7-deazaguanine synthase